MLLQVTFLDGVSSASITLLVSPDNAAELDEVTLVTLTEVVVNGVPVSGDQTRGARIASGQRQAVITVQANDDPHGVVMWSPSIVTAEEQEGTDNIVPLTLVREFGTVGAIIISYATAMDMSLPLQDQAEALQDFIPTSNDVVIGDGERSASVSVTILQVCQCRVAVIPNLHGYIILIFRTTLLNPMRVSWSPSLV